MKHEVIRLFLASLKYAVITVFIWSERRKQGNETDVLIFEHKSVLSYFYRV